jgi:hypothetical protein
LFDDLKTAQGWIMAGKVVVDGRVVTRGIQQPRPIVLFGRPVFRIARLAGDESLQNAVV